MLGDYGTPTPDEIEANPGDQFDGDVTPDETPTDQPVGEPTTAPAGDDAPPARYERLDRKYWGKTPAEIARMHQEAKREMSRARQRASESGPPVADSHVYRFRLGWGYRHQSFTGYIPTACI